jgi:DNA-binding MarR family transcriptional regulator
MKPEYVNMPDVNFVHQSGRADREASDREASERETDPGRPMAGRGELRWDIIELLFFAYRDFVGDADEVLRAYGFGRAHHRVVHFVSRYPGLKVADLLDVLRITKQSLGRVLKQLLDEEFIVQRSGDVDRRQRLLFATPKGEALVTKLAGLQTARIDRALRDVGAGDAETIRHFLRAMIDRHDPDKVLETILGATDT